MASIEFEKIGDLRALVGQEVVVSDWLEVSQQMISEFAETTHDRQWIHVDPERARKESPFGGAIAHGFLTLSLLSPLASGAIRIRGARMGVNYGFNRVRFTAPLPAGSRIRGRFLLKEFKDIPGGAEMILEASIERDGSDKPVCVAEWITRRYE
jgi:acyl dehydratase